MASDCDFESCVEGHKSTRCDLTTTRRSRVVVRSQQVDFCDFHKRWVKSRITAMSTSEVSTVTYTVVVATTIWSNKLCVTTKRTNSWLVFRFCDGKRLISLARHNHTWFLWSHLWKKDTLSTTLVRSQLTTCCDHTRELCCNTQFVSRLSRGDHTCGVTT